MKIESIENGEIEHTWDLEIPDIHEYILENGCVSHNTSQLLCNKECIEPIHSNYYTRSTLAGYFDIINKYLLEDIKDCDFNKLKKDIIDNNGSVQNLDLSDKLKLKHKTVWEMNQLSLAKMSQERGVFVDQSESHNVFFSDPTHENLTNYHLYSWALGLKTGMYYLRCKPTSNGEKYNDVYSKSKLKEKWVCKDEICELCSS